MKRSEIDALLRAHGGRARPVAFLHILRQPALEEDDHRFLLEHDRELTIADLLRWRSRCEPGFTAAPIRALGRVALDEPARFEHELLESPSVTLADEEWIELGDLVRGKVPESRRLRILDRSRRRAPREPPGLPEPPPAPPAETEGFADLVVEIEDLVPPVPSSPIDAALAPEVVLDRARNAFSAEERAALLGWLAARGAPRQTILPIAFAAARAGELSRDLSAFIATAMPSRAAWEAHGVDCFLAFVDRGALSELLDLCTDVHGRAEAPAGGLVAAMHAAFAGGLVAIAREAIAAEQSRRALAALAALTCLDPPARLSRALHELGPVAGDDSDVRELFELNARLLKRGRPREASLEGLVAAIHTLADAL